MRLFDLGISHACHNTFASQAGHAVFKIESHSAFNTKSSLDEHFTSPKASSTTAASNRSKSFKTSKTCAGWLVQQPV